MPTAALQVPCRVGEGQDEAALRCFQERWIVKRTFACFMKNRRFARNYEQLTAVAETLVVIAAFTTLFRRGP